MNEAELKRFAEVCDNVVKNLDDLMDRLSKAAGKQDYPDWMKEKMK